MSWGSGFSARGVLPRAVQILCNNDPTACQKLADVGIALISRKKQSRVSWWRIVDIESGLVEQGTNALRLIQFDKQLLSILIELAEDRNHAQNWVDAQFQAFIENRTAWTSRPPGC